MHPEDKKFGQLLINNLLEILKVSPMTLAGNNEPILGTMPSFNFKLLSDPKSRLITMKAFTDQQTQVRGYDFKFELAAPVILHEIGYYGGFGEKGSLGFGCVE